MLDNLTVRPADSLLGLIRQYGEDPRPHKIDLGVGVYRDEAGRTPVFHAVKTAERRLLETQDSKAYLGPEGDVRFVELMRDLMLGDAVPAERVIGLQSPGGTGALRLTSDLAKQAGAKRAWLGLPTWPNHEPILRASGLRVETYDYFEVAQQTVRFDSMMDAFEHAERGDVVVLQGCCHNPTGADLTEAQWSEVAGVVERQGLLPLLDLAYAGLGRGLEKDVAGVREVVSRVPEALLAVSCSKNFGLYRERTGAVFAVGRSAGAAQAALSNLLGISRASYSMPPDHGAAVVRIILDDPELKQDWRAELDRMRERIGEVRQSLSNLGMVGGVDLAPIGRELGMFSMLPLSVEQIRRLKTEFGVYMAESGRANLAGLRCADIEVMAWGLAAVLG